MAQLPLSKAESQENTTAVVIMAAAILAIATGIHTLGGLLSDIRLAEVNIVRSEYGATHDKISTTADTGAEKRNKIQDNVDALRRKLEARKNENSTRATRAVDRANDKARQRQSNLEGLSNKH
ncbi:hypothetical protein CspeluHIS016_0402300 [Cutaneotrichosporon spelunceum]|uniref:Uncharacterized protein n=1 Tax=Cutaneotrichosporon spelunceum TaxID=1672016 RepID=A0AAD3YBV1_9TREE|nr:hypothetical protein CspeluHIS016_0402300 [Cutaneotrichosporon spelunceum]